MSARRDAELEASEPWRKAGFLVRPYHGNNREDAIRFARELPSALDLHDLSKATWTAGDVLRGDHEAGSNNPIPAGGAAATRATKIAAATVRSKATLALLVKHVLNTTLCDKLRAFRAAAPLTCAEDAWNDFLAVECGGATSEPVVDTIQAGIRAATIVGLVGYSVGSVQNMINWMQAENRTITNAADRFTDEKLASMLLEKIAKANQTGVSVSALQEYNRPPAEQTLVVAGTTNRSLPRVIEVMGREWDAAVNAAMIHPRPKGGRQASLGNSTRVDGHEAMFDAHAAESQMFEYEPSSGAVRGINFTAPHERMSAFEVFLEHDHSVDELQQAFSAALSAQPQGAMQREKICFRCFGLGHTENEDPRARTKGCPSPKRSPARDINAYLLMIGALAARRNGRDGRTRVPHLAELR
jgi:hypothetical protein